MHFIGHRLNVYRVSEKSSDQNELFVILGRKLDGNIQNAAILVCFELQSRAMMNCNTRARIMIKRCSLDSLSSQLKL